MALPFRTRVTLNRAAPLVFEVELRFCFLRRARRPPSKGAAQSNVTGLTERHSHSSQQEA